MVGPFLSAGVGILAGNGDGTFQAMVLHPTTWGVYNLDIGDLDGDGHLDVAADAATATWWRCCWVSGTAHCRQK